MNKQKGRILPILLSFCVLVALVLYGIMPMLSSDSLTEKIFGGAAPEPTQSAEVESKPTPKPIETTDFGKTVQKLLAEIAAQESTDEIILEELASGAYSIEEPLIIVDPYNCSPLTALVVFSTQEPAKISVELKGKTKQADASFAFDAFNTDHLIPIYGLYADTENEVSLTATTQAGEATVSQLFIQTDPLPQVLDGVMMHSYAPKPEQYQEGFNFGYAYTKYAYDIHGDVRWINSTWAGRDVALYQLDEGIYTTTDGSYSQGDVLLFQRNLLGKLIRVMYSPYGSHHEIESSDQGTVLFAGSKGTMVEDFIYEVDTLTGAIANTLDLKTVFPVSSVVSYPNGKYDDWFHLNTITWEKDTIIVSGRNMSTVAKLDWPSGDIHWILAPHYGWLPRYQEYLLTPIGEGFEWPSYQHAPEILPDLDNDPDTIDILLFDNGAHRTRNDADLLRRIKANQVVSPESYSRMVHYRIHEKEMTIEQIWQYGKERGAELYSSWRGDSDLQANGNRLGLFSLRKKIGDKTMDYAIASEVTEEGEIIWEMILTKENGDYDEYRIERQPFYSQASLDLHIGAPTQNLIPNSVLTQNGVQ